jgi:alkylation response protein AidB-like acyl-CoA dehydrogenase
MSEFQAPLKDMQFALRHLGDLAALEDLEGFEGLSADLVLAVLEEAGRLAEQEIAPHYQLADEQGTSLVDGQVRVPEQIRNSYQQFVAGGWPSLPFDPKYGGQGLPHLLSTAVMEIWKTANLSFSLCPMLTNGAAEALQVHGSETLKQMFLPQLISGEWTGTMNLTEPQAGSDLAALRSRAEPRADGDYLISGRKIFITWGDHEMTDNIAHLVLARLPDAPPGVRGISLFLVPKFLVNEDGSLGQRNDVTTVSVEHKLGIHGSPTCSLNFGDNGGAVGYLVGEEHQGLACMFTMMNHARLAVGVEGLAMAELAYQKSLAYARERVQGQIPGKGPVTIIHHPDIRRMLMTMRAYVEAMRGLAYVTAANLDLAEHGASQPVRAVAADRVGLLTPVVKGWCTEIGQELASLGIQVHGGMGYVEETGIAQVYRDVRITTIYEGTTGIQANDLIGRKLIRDNGQALSAALDEIEEVIAATSIDSQLESISRGLASGREALAGARDYLLANHANDIAIPGAAAVPLLLLCGTVMGGWQLARGALAASQQLASAASETDRDYLQARIVVAQFYMDHLMPKALAYRASIEAGAASTMGLSDEQF